MQRRNQPTSPAPPSAHAIHQAVRSQEKLCPHGKQVLQDAFRQFPQGLGDGVPWYCRLVDPARAAVRHRALRGCPEERFIPYGAPLQDELIRASRNALALLIETAGELPEVLAAADWADAAIWTVQLRDVSGKSDPHGASLALEAFGRLGGLERSSATRVLRFAVNAFCTADGDSTRDAEQWLKHPLAWGADPNAACLEGNGPSCLRQAVTHGLLTEATADLWDNAGADWQETHRHPRTGINECLVTAAARSLDRDDRACARALVVLAPHLPTQVDKFLQKGHPATDWRLMHALSAFPQEQRAYVRMKNQLAGWQANDADRLQARTSTRLLNQAAPPAAARASRARL